LFSRVVITNLNYSMDLVRCPIVIVSKERTYTLQEDPGSLSKTSPSVTVLIHSLIALSSTFASKRPWPAWGLEVTRCRASSVHDLMYGRKDFSRGALECLCHSYNEISRHASNQGVHKMQRDGSFSRFVCQELKGAEEAQAVSNRTN
jgi:hypothetical protein